MHIIVISVHPVVEGLALEAAASLGHRHNPDPVTLGQDPLCGEADSMGFYQLTRGVVDCSIWETCHRRHLEERISMTSRAE